MCMAANGSRRNHGEKKKEQRERRDNGRAERSEMDGTGTDQKSKPEGKGDMEKRQKRRLDYTSSVALFDRDQFFITKSLRRFHKNCFHLATLIKLIGISRTRERCNRIRVRCIIDQVYTYICVYVCARARMRVRIYMCVLYSARTDYLFL